jgi:DNA-directed RNA polymerase beta subunit
MADLKQNSVSGVDANDLTAILDSILVKERSLICHHVDSFNQFVENGIKSIMTETFRIVVEYNNIRDATPEDKSIEKYVMEAKILDVSLSSPTTVNFDTQKHEILYPCEAHRKDLTYSSSMKVSVEITCKAFKKDGTVLERSDRIEDYRIGSIPVMVGSNLCNTHKLTREAMLHIKEDPTDLGGYFIIKSNEWIIDNIESMTYNLPREFKVVSKNASIKNELARSDIISKPGDNFENSSNIVCKYLNNGNIQFEITNNRFKNIAIPFYVLFRAFGVCDDKAVTEHIVYGMELQDKVNDPVMKKMLTIIEAAFVSKYNSLGDAYSAHTQVETLELIGRFINDYYLGDAKDKESMNTRKYNVSNVLSILDKDILPHVGLTAEARYNKARFLGHLIHRLLLAHMDIIPSTDRDSYKNKRVNPAGVSYAKVFKTNFNFAIVQPVRRQFIKDLKSTSFSNLNLAHSFETAIYGHEFERALVHAIIIGDKTISINRKSVQNRLSSQQLHRKNQINVISALRNINTTNTSSAKQSERANEMRRVHSSTIGYVCCIQSADTGEKVGMQKQMAVSSRIALGSSSQKLKEIVIADVIPLDKVTNVSIYLEKLTKVFVNGYWIGCTKDHSEFTKKYRDMRRKGSIHYMTTIVMDFRTNEVYLWTDIGRIVRPLIIVYSGESGQYIKLTKEHIHKLNAGLIDYNDLLDEEIIEFISPEEQQNCLIAKDIETLTLHKTSKTMHFTHLDIAQSIVGIPGLTSPFTNHNQPARGIFQTNQVKQTCGVPCMNFPYKTYKEMFMQVYNQKPLVKTMANKYIQPIGMNAVVAIQIYGGYNQDDSLMMNQGAIDRGLFTTHHFTFEKTELDKNEEFSNPDPITTTDIKAYSDYSKLVNGVVPVGTLIEKGDIVIGKICKLGKTDQYGNYTHYDKSVVYKYEEPSYVWDVIKGRNEDDSVFCKVVFRSVRKVEIGNKFSSRSGQKGTVGMIYRDSDMPFSSSGMRPDIIFNSHSLPSRMTMGVILEGLSAKVSAHKGTIFDATIFKKTNISDISGMLKQIGFNANGTERLYNGITGHYMDVEIFIAPIYYQCLQKFTVDTVYAHRETPTDALTRQPLDGKSAQGGTRMGEMEHACLATSAVKSLHEKSADHSDMFYIYVCKNCKRRAIVNEEKKIYKCNTCHDDSDIVKIKTTWSVKTFMDEIESCNIGMDLYPKETTFQKML